MASFKKIKSFCNKEKYVDLNWTYFVQKQLDYVYATNVHLMIRAKYQPEFENEQLEMQTEKVQLNTWFDKGDLLGTFSKKEYNEFVKNLTEDEIEWSMPNVKLLGFYFALKYLKKIVSTESNFEVYKGNHQNKSTIFVGKNCEILLMQVLPDNNLNCKTIK